MYVIVTKIFSVVQSNGLLRLKNVREINYYQVMDDNSTHMTKVWAIDLSGILYRRTNCHSSSTEKCRHDCVRSDFLPIRPV
jgi:hypothetical protein